MHDEEPFMDLKSVYLSYKRCLARDVKNNSSMDLRFSSFQLLGIGEQIQANCLAGICISKKPSVQFELDFLVIYFHRNEYMT